MLQNTLALVADNANVDANRKVYVLGVFRYLGAKTLPATHPQFSIVAQWTADIGEVPESSKLEISVVDVDGVAFAPRWPPLPIKFVPIGEAEPNKVEASIVVNVQNFVLQKHGYYVFQFFVNGRAAGEASVFVSRIPSPTLPNAT